MRTRVMNQLHVVALNEGLRRKKALWRPAGRNELESLKLAALGQPTTPRLARLTGSTDAEDPGSDAPTGTGSGEATGDAAADDASRRGPADGTGLRVSGRNAQRFHCGKQIASYVGLVPTEESSGDRRRLGHISKQGNVLLRFLLVEAAQVTVRSHPEWRSTFFHLALRRGRKIAKVAMARKLAVHLYWMWRQGLDYGQLHKLGSHAGEPGNPHGVQ